MPTEFGANLGQLFTKGLIFLVQVLKFGGGIRAAVVLCTAQLCQLGAESFVFCLKVLHFCRRG